MTISRQDTEPNPTNQQKGGRPHALHSNVFSYQTLAPFQERGNYGTCGRAEIPMLQTKYLASGDGEV